MIRRGAHKNIQALEADIRAWVKDWNEAPKPFIWTKTAEEILDSLAPILPTDLRRRKLVGQGRGRGLLLGGGLGAGDDAADRLQRQLG